MGTSSEIYIFTNSQNQKSKLEEISKFLKGVEAPSHWKLEIDSEGKLCLDTGEGLPFFLRASSIHTALKSQPLVKAIGFKKNPLHIVDVTAGWGKDAFLLAELGCHVTAIESHKLVFAFLKEFREQVQVKGFLDFKLGDSLSYLKKIGEQPDVIYFDPLFQENKKSLSQKSLRILQELTFQENQNTEELFEVCLKKAKNRVVMKRHRLQKPFKGNLLCTFSGRSVCFDVFAPVTI